MNLLPKPHRLQRRRTKGFRLPAYCVSVTRPGILGNPFTGPRAVQQFERYLELALTFQSLLLLDENLAIADRMRSIAESSLSVACFCSLGDDCHGDVILRFAERIRKGWPEWIRAEEVRHERRQTKALHSRPIR